jgi:hypothetical protein
MDLGMSQTLPLGSAGWIEAKADGSFTVQLRGVLSRGEADRLARWLLERGESIDK